MKRKTAAFALFLGVFETRNNIESGKRISYLVKKTNGMKKIVILFWILLGFQVGVNAQTKTIHVVPDNAKIYVNGQEVGTGMYVIKFTHRDDFVQLKFEAPGYQTRNVRLMKNNPQKTLSYRLTQDEAALNSVGVGEGMDLANKYFTVTCKKGLTEEVIWKRLMNIAINNFENVDVRDKEAGWIRTAWARTLFSNGQTVRTRLEIRLQTLGDGSEPSYRVKITSEIADKEECPNLGEECFQKYDRILKKYEQVVNELQTTVGSNN